MSNPEFLARGTAVKDLLFPDRVIIGTSGKDEEMLGPVAALRALYSSWVPVEKIMAMNDFSSELAKVAANAMLAQRVSSISALSMICDKAGASIKAVSQVLGSDSRIGPGMLRAGPGFGGRYAGSENKYIRADLRAAAS